MNLEFSKYLDENGIKHSNKGYIFLLEAMMIMCRMQRMKWVLDDIYEEIAKKYSVNKCSVERTIRYSLLKTNLSNKEFLARAFDNIVLDNKTNCAVPEIIQAINDCTISNAVCF